LNKFDFQKISAKLKMPLKINPHIMFDGKKGGCGCGYVGGDEDEGGCGCGSCK